MQWNPPTNTDQSDTVDHYIVYVPSRNIMDIESSTISVLRIPNCHGDNIGIQVGAVNRFGCVGMNSSVVHLSFDSVQTTTQGTDDAQTTEEARGSTTSTAIGSTSTSSKY